MGKRFEQKHHQKCEDCKNKLMKRCSTSPVREGQTETMTIYHYTITRMLKFSRKAIPSDGPGAEQLKLS